MSTIDVLIVAAVLVLAGCVGSPPVSESVKQSREAIKELKGGVKEPYYPPYCWISPPGSDLWYPCGSQTLSDEEIGKHGH